MDPGYEANYTHQWAEMHGYLDSVAAAGMHVYVWVGLDTLAICRTGYPATGEGVDAGCQKLNETTGLPICLNSR